MKQICLRKHAAAIVELFEELLDNHDVTLPSEDDGQKEADNAARLYGMTYAQLEDSVVGILSDLGEQIRENPKAPLVDSY